MTGRRLIGSDAVSLLRHCRILAGLGALLTSPPGGAQSVAPTETSVSVPAADLHFYRNKDGLMFADAWGDPASGPHSNFIRMAADTASPLHTHSASYYGVVIAGVVTNEPSAGVPGHPMAAGSYWFQKGRAPHVTKCVSHVDCLIFVTAPAAFDFLPVR